MAWPTNAEVLQGISKTSFFGALASQESMRIYPKLAMPIDQSDLTVTYTSFGNVPEPRQLSGTVASTGARQEKHLEDYTLQATVVEFETTVVVPRSVIETNPSEIPRITAQMAEKSSLFMDRRFVATALPSSVAGYDGVSLYNDAHPESGTNQDNNTTSVVASDDTIPTAAELETRIDLDILALHTVTDDQGTPVNEGVDHYTILVPIAYKFLYKNVLEPAKNTLPGLDVSGGTGRFRGMFTVLGSSFVAAADRHYVFADKVGTKAVALMKNKQWDFKTNIGTASDLWNFSQKALFTAYARFEFFPWDWKITHRHVWTT